MLVADVPEFRFAGSLADWGCGPTQHERAEDSCSVMMKFRRQEPRETTVVYGAIGQNASSPDIDPRPLQAGGQDHGVLAGQLGAYCGKCGLVDHHLTRKVRYQRHDDPELVVC